MNTPLGNRAATYRSPVCFYCGALTTECPGYAHPVCDVCDTGNTFSDGYKELNGMRPNLTSWSLAEQKAWLATNW